MDSLDDIKYLRLKVRQDTARYNLTDNLKEQIRNWNYLDYSIYEHFNKKLNKEVNCCFLKFLGYILKAVVNFTSE